MFYYVYMYQCITVLVYCINTLIIVILLPHMKVSSVTTHEDSRAAKNLVDFDGRIEEAENALSDAQKVSVTWPLRRFQT